VEWSSPPEREEAGSPNTVGAVALGAAIHQLESIGMRAVADHEAQLTQYALENLLEVRGIEIFGDTDPARSSERLGVIPFRLQGISHFLVAAILGHEYGIGVRSGCFCSHPYILHLLGLTPQQSRAVRARMLAGDKTDMPGLVRISFGLYNTLEDIDILVQALRRITTGDYTGIYTQQTASGEFTPSGWDPKFEQYFTF
jgi:selenocysteine lyase/cysteine desulfurase